MGSYLRGWRASMRAPTKKHSAPSAVFQLAAARSRIEPVSGTTYAATAEIAKKMQPARFTAAIVFGFALAR